jgi:hypothetical protein
MFLDSLHDINVNDNNINIMFDDTTNKMFTETGFQTDLWYYCLRNKLHHLINVLKNHECLKNIKYFISTDCDIIYIKNNINEWYNLENYMQNENKDIYFMREHTSSDINGGFYIIKNNDNITNIINFLIEVSEILDTSKNADYPYGEQTIINNLKNKINYGIIPNEYVIWGSSIYNINKSLFHHAVCTRDVYDKIEQINQIKSNFI